MSALVEKAASQIGNLITLAVVAIFAWNILQLLNYIAFNFSARNISYYNHLICDQNASAGDHEDLADEYARYEDFKGRPHRFTHMDGDDICEEIE